MDAETTRRRIKAARVLAGFDSADELAEQLRDQGLGPRTVRKIESGERPVRPMELREIARVCSVPYEFFTTEAFDELGAERVTAQDQLDAMQQMIANVLSIVGPAGTYAEFVQDVRDTVIPLSGEVQNELDAARLAHELPTQRLADEVAPAAAPRAGRRRGR